MEKKDVLRVCKMWAVSKAGWCLLYVVLVLVAHSFTTSFYILHMLSTKVRGIYFVFAFVRTIK